VKLLWVIRNSYNSYIIGSDYSVQTFLHVSQINGLKGMNTSEVQVFEGGLVLRGYAFLQN